VKILHFFVGLALCMYFDLLNRFSPGDSLGQLYGMSSFVLPPYDANPHSKANRDDDHSDSALSKSLDETVSVCVVLRVKTRYSQ
jgi:hypothetical protein